MKSWTTTGTAVVLLLSATPTWAKDPAQRYCDEWKKAIATEKTREDAVRRVWVVFDVDARANAWAEAIWAASTTPQEYASGILSRRARELGYVWDCPAFDFPAGPSTAERLLTGRQPEQPLALSADDRGVFWLSGSPSGTGSLFRLEGQTSVKVAGDFSFGPRPAMALTDKSVVVVLGSEVVSVPRTGGPPTTLLKGPGPLTFLAVDGRSLVLRDAAKTFSLSLTNGAVETLDTCVKKGGSPSAAADAARVKALLGTTNAGAVDAANCEFPPTALPSLRAFRGLSNELLQALSEGPSLVVGKSAYFPFGRSPAATEIRSLRQLANRADPPPPAPPPLGMYRLDMGSTVPVRVAEFWDGTSGIASGDQLFGVADEGWVTRQRLIAWRPGAKAPATVAFPVGDVQLVAANTTHVYWFDDSWHGLYRAPRPR